MSAPLNAPPTPRAIYEYLDKHVVGQEKAKKVLSVAVHNHYKRISRTESGGDAIATTPKDSSTETLIEKSNVILLGPSGSGKTLLTKTIARFLDLPFATCDCTGLTEAGYVGDNVEDVFYHLLQVTGRDVEKAQRGIVFLDEVDKIASKVVSGYRDVGGRGVQQSMLKILEGTVIKIDGCTIDTTNILFVASGAFVTLDEIVAKRKSNERIENQAKNSCTKISTEEKNEEDSPFEGVEAGDLIKFGLIPEFVGRFPVISTLHSPSEDMLLQFLDGPRNSLLSQFRMLLKMDECDLTFDEAALRGVARRALKLGTGFRALRALVEEILLDPLFETPGSDIIEVRIQGGAVEGKAAANYIRRAKDAARTSSVIS